MPEDGQDVGPLADSWLLDRRPTAWLLLSGNRLVVSAGLLALAGALFWGVVLAGLAPLTERTPVLFIIFALIGGNFTLITIVVSISQFILARHLQSPGEIREQLEEIIGYRRAVGEVTRRNVLPVMPKGFVLLLFRGIERDSERLRAADWGDADGELQAEVEETVAELDAHAGHVIDLLDGRNGSVRNALFATLNANYSLFFYDAYRLRTDHGEDLPAEVVDALSRLEQHVEQVDIARRYFKSVFIQSELSALTRLLLYAGSPIQVVLVALMLVYTAPPDTFALDPVLPVLVPLLVTLGFAPFAFLTAYILRLSTVVQRTTVMYPFMSEQSEF